MTFQQIQEGCCHRRDRRYYREPRWLASAGPTWNELSLAKALLKFQLEEELARVNGAPTPTGAPRPLSGARLRNALRPGSLERLIQDLDEVSSNSVRVVVRRTFSRRHRVVVTPWPEGWSALAAAGTPPGAAGR